MKINQSLLERVSDSPETKGLSIAQVEEVLRSFGKEVVRLRDGLQRAPYLIVGVDEVEVSFGVDLDEEGVKPVFRVAAAILGDRHRPQRYLCVSIVDCVIRFHWAYQDKKKLVYSFGHEGFELDDNDQYTAWDLYGEGSDVAPREEVIVDN